MFGICILSFMTSYSMLYFYILLDLIQVIQGGVGLAVTFHLLCLTVYCGDILFCWRSVFIQATTECYIPLESV